MNSIEQWDLYLPSFPLHICRHGDDEECPICLFERDVIVQSTTETEGRA